MAKKDLWQTISLHPLTGMMDTRSRPADIPAGGFRWKENFAVTSDGKLCRRQGFERWTPNTGTITNGDFHFRNGTREPVTFMFESTTGDGARRFFCGTQSDLWLLDQSTGLYNRIASGLGADGSRWHAAELQDTILFVNNNDLVRFWQPGFGEVQILTGLSMNVNIATAAVVVSYNGFMIVMNIVRDGLRKSSEVYWSDINNPTVWDLDNTITGSLAGFQDLDYGDEILAAAPLLGALYIFTRRAIWRMMPSGDPTTIFAFTKIYSEPKNQSGCLAFPNTLVSDGENLYYMGRDGIYRYNPYIPVPVRDDWLHRADGLIYRKLDTQMDAAYCAAPVAEYVPSNREIWISWPDTTSGGINNWTLVAQVEQHTADVVDHGFTSMVNFRLTPESAQKCNEDQYFLAASGTDWTIKSIGGVFLRELYSVGIDPTADIPLDTQPYDIGYYSVLRGMVPLGLTDREKKIRQVTIDHDTSDADSYPVVQLRIGNSHNLVDANDFDTHCAPQWRVINTDLVNGVVNPPLRCPDLETIPEMAPFPNSATKSMTIGQAQAGLVSRRTNTGMDWGCMETGRYLYYEITVQNADGSPALGGDSCVQKIDFDAMVMPKP